MAARRWTARRLSFRGDDVDHEQRTGEGAERGGSDRHRDGGERRGPVSGLEVRFGHGFAYRSTPIDAPVPLAPSVGTDVVLGHLPGRVTTVGSVDAGAPDRPRGHEPCRGLRNC